MSSISTALHEKIARLVESQPLSEDEFRRIEGMGSHYISLSSEYKGTNHLFSLEINGRTYYIFKTS